MSFKLKLHHWKQTLIQIKKLNHNLPSHLADRLLRGARRAGGGADRLGLVRVLGGREPAGRLPGHRQPQLPGLPAPRAVPALRHRRLHRGRARRARRLRRRVRGRRGGGGRGGGGAAASRSVQQQHRRRGGQPAGRAVRRAETAVLREAQV